MKLGAATLIAGALLCAGCGGRTGLEDFGANINARERLTLRGFDLQLAQSADGSAIVAYSDHDSFASEARLFDPARGWSAPVALSTAQARPNFVRVAADSSGFWALLLAAPSVSEGARDLEVFRYVDGAWQEPVVLSRGSSAEEATLAAAEEGAFVVWAERQTPNNATHVFSAVLDPQGDFRISNFDIGKTFAVRTFASARIANGWSAAWQETRLEPGNVSQELGGTVCEFDGSCEHNLYPLEQTWVVSRIAWSETSLSALLLPAVSQQHPWRLLDLELNLRSRASNGLPTSSGAGDSLAGSPRGTRWLSAPGGSAACGRGVITAGGNNSEPPEIRSFRDESSVVHTATVTDLAGEPIVAFTESEPGSKDCSAQRLFWMQRRAGTWTAAERVPSSSRKLSNLQLASASDKTLLGFAELDTQRLVITPLGALR